MSKTNHGQWHPKPFDPRSAVAMDDLADMLDTILNGQERGDYRLTGFALVVFPWGEGGGKRLNYISNAERPEVIALLKQVLRGFEEEE